MNLKKAKVINIFGGPGCGKSTTACGLFYKLKLKDYDTELVREYVKKWAWEGILPNKFDQIYITGKQSKAEHMLYDKVDFIITDCPLMMGVFYEQFYYGTNLVKNSVDEFQAMAIKDGVEYHNFLLKRTKRFNPDGRFCDEDGAKKIDDFIENQLETQLIPYTKLDYPKDEVVDVILKHLGLTDEAKNT